MCLLPKYWILTLNQTQTLEFLVQDFTVSVSEMKQYFFSSLNPFVWRLYFCIARTTIWGPLLISLYISPLFFAAFKCADGTAGTACCTSSNQCGEGEGDCDSDDDCKGNLKCGEGSGHDNNCDNTLGFPADYDCCYDASKG